jgi:hypothetical protein
LKRSGVALIDGGSLGARGGRDSVGVSDSVVGANNTDGTSKGGEDEDDGGEEANKHLGLNSEGEDVLWIVELGACSTEEAASKMGALLSKPKSGY